MFSNVWKKGKHVEVPVVFQTEKIRKCVAIFKENGFNPKYFFAPSHTYEKSTLEALKLESDIRIISDTIATKPYREVDFVFIPQLGGHCSEMKIPGIWTSCLHPTAMNDAQFDAVETFLKEHKDEFVASSDLDLESLGRKSLLGKILSWAYFTMRKLKGLK